MEIKVEKIDRFWGTELINLADFYENWKSLLDLMDPYKNVPQSLGKDINPALKSILNMTNEMFDAVQRDTDPTDLTCSEELYTDFEVSEIKSTHNLNTLEAQKRELIRRSDETHLKGTAEYFRNFNYPRPQRFNFDEEEDQLSAPLYLLDIILTVQIYRPVSNALQTKATNQKGVELCHVDQEFNLRGSQYLHELRDAISCVSDFATAGDYSESPHLPIEIRARQMFPSALFSFENNFFNDLRSPNSSDNSEIIRKWLWEKKKIMSTVAKMEETKFIDLKIRLGYPYLFQHQGVCEHLVVFSDLRMMTKDDEPNISKYPLPLPAGFAKRIMCMTCRSFTAKWLVSKHDMLPEDPFFFCDKCYHSFNYDSEGRKVCNFQSQPFTDRSSIL